MTDDEFHSWIASTVKPRPVPASKRLAIIQDRLDGYRPHGIARLRAVSVEVVRKILQENERKKRCKKRMASRVTCG